MDCAIPKEEGIPYSQFNIFDYVDQSKFMGYSSKKQSAIQKFLKAFVEIKIISREENSYGCPVCRTTTKNELCRYCIGDFFGSCRPLSDSFEYVGDNGFGGKWKKRERF